MSHTPVNGNTYEHMGSTNWTLVGFQKYEFCLFQKYEYVSWEHEGI